MKLIEQLREKRKAILAEIRAVNDACEAAEGRDLTDEELVTVTAKRGECDALTVRIDELVEDDNRAAAAADADQSETRNEVRRVERVNEQRTYRSGGENSFFADAYASRFLQDPEAAGRIAAHMTEARVEGEALPERRDVGTSNIGGLVVPVYLVDEFAAVLRNSRGFLNASRGVPLPPGGMSVIIPRGNTGTAVAAQATQNSGVQETDLDFNSDLTVNVRTFAGDQDVSRQSLERGTPGVDELIYADLVADYATKVDTSSIADDGTSGKHKGILSATGTNAVTYTDATPTVAEAWPKLADARRQVGKNRKIAANLWVMTTTRWGWFTAALDGQSRPLIIDNPSAAVNAMGQTNADQFGEGQLVGTLMGLPVLCDDNIPANLGAGTNEDRILCVRRQDNIILEEGDGVPRRFRFDDVGSGALTVRLLVYGYSAFTAERYPQGKSIISGTGLTAPTF